MRFLLIDDHVVVRSGLKLILSDLYKPCIIDEAEDGESALIKLKLHFYDLIILDIKMPNTNTFTLMEYIRNNYPDLKVLVFSMNSESIYAKRFLNAGAKGFINKIAPLDEIIKAINIILNGKRYISETLLEVLAELGGDIKKENSFDALSPREFEIVSMLLAGDGISQIAQRLNLQVSTIGTHKARIFEKLKVTNLLELKELANSFNL
jgi:DNA-binding NarL/FixJ family response regulator